MIDFTGLPQTKKAYGGANGSKISVIYNGERYMLKFPPLASKNDAMSYSNSCISEYLGCHIFESVGIPVQETLLGTYRVGDVDKIVVACKDFTSPGVTLQDFASLKNQAISSSLSGYGTELADIQDAIFTQTSIDPIAVTERFWDMFVVDALIGNWDRHNGNWGFLYNELCDDMVLAPVFDCGSCLYPQIDSDMMRSVLSDHNEMHKRIFSIPTSAIKVNNRKINYFTFLSSLKEPECNAALERIMPRIDLGKISEIIEGVECIDNLTKEFYNTMLSQRKTLILDHATELLAVHEQVPVHVSERSKKRGIDDVIDTALKSASCRQAEMTPDIECHRAQEH